MSKAKNRSKYTKLTLSQKAEVLKRISLRVPYGKIETDFNIAMGTISKIKQDKDKILSRIANNHAAVNRLSGDLEELDKRVFDWLADLRSRNVPVSGDMIKQAALKAANNLGLADFKASNGWLDNFKKRHSITLRLLSGESAELDQDVVRSWRENVMRQLEGYELKDIFNCDETGLFYRALPSRSLSISGESCKGGKLAKERLTVLLACSATGEKLKPVVIGKSQSPRCFKGMEMRAVHWKWNARAWMTASFFSDWLAGLDRRMGSENRKIALLLDNAPVHPKIDLENVKLFFLPPNTTSGTQPLDAGIIRSFKAFYRRNVLQFVLKFLERDPTSTVSTWVKSVDVSRAIGYILEAWRSVSMETIANCFQHVGVGVQMGPIERPLNSEMDDLIRSLEDLSTQAHIRDFQFDFDDPLTVFEVNDEERAEAILAGQPPGTSDVESDTDEDEEPEEEETTVAFKDTQSAFDILDRFLMQKGLLATDHFVAFTQYRRAWDATFKPPTQQSKITSFFNQ